MRGTSHTSSKLLHRDLRHLENPRRATREYAIHRTDKLITLLGGKWTTAFALDIKVTTTIH